MHKRTNRLVVAALLVAAGIAGGFFVFAAHVKSAAALASGSDISARLDRMIATAGDIASAQQAYVAPGQPDQPWRERSAALLQQFADDAAAVRPHLRSADAGRVVEDIGRGLRTLLTIDGNARQDLQDAQNLLAADLIFSQGRDTVSSLIATIRGLKAAEQQTSTSQYASLERQQWIILGSVATVWIVGLMLLTPLGAGSAAAGAPRTEPAFLTIQAEYAGEPATAAINLTAAADVCASLARISDTAELPAVLERAAAVLDARGIIVWMSAGEELFPALAYGYDDHFISRLGPIPRKAENATADAWRSGKMRTVAGDGVSHGAVATPLAGMSGCVGVFAAEVRHGRENDRATQAVTVMIAAQLASIVSAWPAGSSARPGEITDSGLIAASGGA
jgi:CHASE3 domain sensor protein